MGVRQAVNIWLLGTLISLGMDVIGHSWVYSLPSGLALVAVIIGAIAYGIHKGREFWSHTHTVTPIARGLAEVFGISTQDSEKRLKLEPGYRTQELGKIGKYKVPADFVASDGARNMVEAVIRSRLPQALHFKWALSEGHGGSVEFSVTPKLPKLARLLEIVPEIEALGPRAYITGPTYGGKPHVARFDGPEPHHGYCWGTGVGKSTMLASILAQCKHNEPGLTATIIDPKQISLEFMKGIPGFTFYDEPAEMERKVDGMTQDNYIKLMPGLWKGVYETYQLMGQRAAMMAIDRTQEFNTHLLVMEEANSFCLMSKTWWQRNRPRGAPAQPPIWGDWIAPLFWRGRQFNIFIVLVAQSIQERFLGNLNLRPSLGLVSLAKYKPSQYEAYIGTTPVPRMQKGQGRALFNDGDTDTWVQCLYASEAEFRAFAQTGTEEEADTRVLV
jgi:hypothetical protein